MIKPPNSYGQRMDAQSGRTPCGAAEVLRSGVDGLVVDGPDDVTGLVEALSSLADPATRRAMGQRARHTALRYPWEQPLERTLAVYREVIGAQQGVQSHRGHLGT